MRRTFSVFFVGLLLLIGTTIASAVERVVVNEPGFPYIRATAMDQPRLYGILTDNGEVMTDEGGPVLFRAFIDTGSSGFVLSNLHATGNHDVASFGFDEDDYVGTYTNTGIGGLESGSVSRPFGIRLYNAPFPESGQAAIGDFQPYGEHSLWVRDSPGTGEVVSIDLPGGIPYSLVSPVNIVGMPVIKQRVMVMEWLDIPGELIGLLPEEAKEMQTKLLLPGDSEIPPHNVTLDLAMRDFVGEAPPGETLPSMDRNPVVKNVSISHSPEADSVTADWLFDTGAGSSFVSFDWAQTIGLISESYEDLAAFVVDHEANGGLISEVGGIGEDSVTVPILTIAELSVPAKEGFDLVWENVQVHVLDHPELAELGLEGIFGMNLIGPAATIDASLLGNVSAGDDEMLLLLLMMLSDITPTPFRSIAFEVTGEETGELRLFHKSLDLSAPLPTPFAEWRGFFFDEEELENFSISGPDADPDGDGIVNLLEYALGSSPREPSRDRLPKTEIMDFDGADHLALTYTQADSRDDVEYVVEVSTDMIDWAPADVELMERVSVENGERMTFREKQTLEGSDRRFLRLRVRLIP